MKSRRGQKSRKLRNKRRYRKKSRMTKAYRKQRGGVAHIPDDRFPKHSIISVRDAKDDESPFFSMKLEEAEKDFIAASDRPQDPYD